MDGYYSKYSIISYNISCPPLSLSRQDGPDVCTRESKRGMPVFSAFECFRRSASGVSDVSYGLDTRQICLNTSKS
jgi:hypothetical protein